MSVCRTFRSSCSACNCNCLLPSCLLCCPLSSCAHCPHSLDYCYGPSLQSQQSVRSWEVGIASTDGFSPSIHSSIHPFTRSPSRAQTILTTIADARRGKTDTIDHRRSLTRHSSLTSAASGQLLHYSADISDVGNQTPLPHPRHVVHFFHTNIQISFSNLRR